MEGKGLMNNDTMMIRTQVSESPRKEDLKEETKEENKRVTNQIQGQLKFILKSDNCRTWVRNGHQRYGKVNKRVRTKSGRQLRQDQRQDHTLELFVVTLFLSYSSLIGTKCLYIIENAEYKFNK